MATKYRRFKLIFFAVSFLPLVSALAFNLIIDPYGVFAFPELKGINDLKPEKERTGRIYKSFDIRRIKPSVILLGSSRVEDGLNPQYSALVNNSAGGVYNSGFQAGNTYEILRYLEHAINQQPELQQVVIGLDFFMFNQFLTNQSTFDEKRLSKQYPIKDATTFLLSLDALNSSKNTLIASVKDKEEKPVTKAQQRFRFWIREFLSNEQLYGQYALSQDRLENLRSIVALCQQQDIDLKIFISPTHATQYETIEAAGLWLTFEEWKREVVKITPVWDFAYHNSVTTEVISENMTHHIDSSHYSQDTGNLVLNRVLDYESSTVPQDFGVLITTENIESHLAKNRLQQQKWRNARPEEVKLVERVKTKLK